MQTPSRVRHSYASTGEAHLQVQLCAQRQQHLEAPVIPQSSQDVDQRQARTVPSCSQCALPASPEPPGEPLSSFTLRAYQRGESLGALLHAAMCDACSMHKEPGAEATLAELAEAEICPPTVTGT